MEEVVFFHAASSSLLLADLVIAFEPERVRPHLRWLFGLVGVMWPGQTPREVQGSTWGRGAQARACYQRMLAWQPRRVILGHGRSYAEEGMARLERAFAWLR
jgi:hypothetical protein